MQGRSSAEDVKARPGRNKERRAGVQARPVRTIVFHGDGDATVALTNGEEVARQQLERSMQRAGTRCSRWSSGIRLGAGLHRHALP
jgi:hypothetical protein